jgi:hypothetical protein
LVLTTELTKKKLNYTILIESSLSVLGGLCGENKKEINHKEHRAHKEKEFILQL